MADDTVDIGVELDARGDLVPQLERAAAAAKALNAELARTPAATAAMGGPGAAAAGMASRTPGSLSASTAPPVGMPVSAAGWPAGTAPFAGAAPPYQPSYTPPQVPSFVIPPAPKPPTPGPQSGFSAEVDAMIAADKAKKAKAAEGGEGGSLAQTWAGIGGAVQAGKAVIDVASAAMQQGTKFLNMAGGDPSLQGLTASQYGRQQAESLPILGTLVQQFNALSDALSGSTASIKANQAAWADFGFKTQQAIKRDTVLNPLIANRDEAQAFAAGMKGVAFGQVSVDPNSMDWDRDFANAQREQQLQYAVDVSQKKLDAARFKTGTLQAQEAEIDLQSAFYDPVAIDADVKRRQADAAALANAAWSPAAAAKGKASEVFNVGKAAGQDALDALNAGLQQAGTGSTLTPTAQSSGVVTDRINELTKALQAAKTNPTMSVDESARAQAELNALLDQRIAREGQLKSAQEARNASEMAGLQAEKELNANLIAQKQNMLAMQMQKVADMTGVYRGVGALDEASRDLALQAAQRLKAGESLSSFAQDELQLIQQTGGSRLLQQAQEREASQDSRTQQFTDLYGLGRKSLTEERAIAVDLQNAVNVNIGVNEESLAQKIADKTAELLERVIGRVDAIIEAEVTKRQVGAAVAQQGGS